jgi:hypothetical protein
MQFRENAMPGLRAGGSVIICLHPASALFAHAASQLWIARELLHGGVPFIRCSCEQTRLAVPHDLTMHANRVGYDGQSRGHVLQHFQTTLAVGPRIVGQPGNPHVGGG